MVKIHGRIQLPLGAVRKGVIRGYHWSGPKNLRNFGGYHRTTPQGRYDIDMGDELIRRMQTLFQRPLEVDRSESCWLAFRDVGPHTDDSFYYLGGRGCALPTRRPARLRHSARLVRQHPGQARRRFFTQPARTPLCAL